MGLFDLFRKESKSLDENLNKWWFVVKIRLVLDGKTKTYDGYIYPTNNWVEVHCFDDVKHERKKYWANHGYKQIEGGYIIKEDDFGFKTWMKSRWAIFGKRIYSFIIPRNKVLGNKDRIECNPSEEDFERWKEWHKDDDYHKEIWMEDVEFSWIDSHQGEGAIHYFDVKSGKERMYPLK